MVVTGVIWYAAFVFSATFHEAAHALVAKRGGDLTAYLGGQVTLDPWPHIRREPIGMVVIPILSFVLGGFVMGYASAPMNAEWSLRHPRRAGYVSLAGPVSNFVLAFLAAIGIRLGSLLGAFVPATRTGLGGVAVASPSAGAVAGAVAILFSVMFALNLALFLFNLIPVPPMDGFGIIPIFLSDEQGHRFQLQRREVQRMAFLGLIVAWKLFPYIFRPTFAFARSVLFL